MYIKPEKLDWLCSLHGWICRAEEQAVKPDCSRPDPGNGNPPIRILNLFELFVGSKRPAEIEIHILSAIIFGNRFKKSSSSQLCHWNRFTDLSRTAFNHQ